MTEFTGILGLKALTKLNNGSYISPLYGSHWDPNTIKVAHCPDHLRPPCDENDHVCGFHAAYTKLSVSYFLHSMTLMANCLVLIEGTGKLLLHEKGFRSEFARIVASVWDVPDSINGRFALNGAVETGKYFGVPVIETTKAESMIDHQYILLGV